MNRFASLFVNNKYVQGASEIRDLLAGLHACANNNFGVPLVLVVKGSEVRVTNVLDKFATDVKVTLQKDGSIPEQTLKAVSSTENVAFKLDLPSLAPGFYSLAFKITPQAKSERFSSQSNVVRPYKVNGELRSATVKLFATKGADGSEATKADTSRLVHVF